MPSAKGRLQNHAAIRNRPLITETIRSNYVNYMSELIKPGTDGGKYKHPGDWGIDRIDPCPAIGLHKHGFKRKSNKMKCYRSRKI